MIANNKVTAANWAIIAVAVAFVALLYAPYYIPVKIDEYVEYQPLPCTYVINLDRATERYRKLKSQLDRYEISHRRFSAVDGYELRILSNITFDKFSGLDLKSGKVKLHLNSSYQVFCPHFIFHYTPNRDLFPRTLGPGELGCYCSHVEVWRDIKNKGFPFVLILEDDAVISDDFDKKLQAVLHNLPKGWDVVNIQRSTRANGKLRPIAGNSIIEKVNPDNELFHHTTSYLISASGALKLINYARSSPWAIDDVISDAINKRVITVYDAKDILVIYQPDNSEKSIISKMGRGN